MVSLSRQVVSSRFMNVHALAYVLFLASSQVTIHGAFVLPALQDPLWGGLAHHPKASAYMAHDLPYKNAYIASLTTCWALVKIYDFISQLGEDVLYYDTESVIHISRNETEHLETKPGDYLSDLLDELPHGKNTTGFISTAHKSYTYRDNKEATTLKSKLIAQTLFNMQRMNF